MTSYAEFYRQSIDQRDNFWAEQAQLIDWQTPFEQVLDDSKLPFARWFVGGKTNLCYNAVDRHLKDRAEQKAITYLSTETGKQGSYTFRELHAEVNRVAAMLMELGVGQGDRVIIYMPMVAEAVFAMLACVRIGAVHSVVFGGFAAHSLATRIDDALPKVLITADAGMRGGKQINVQAAGRRGHEPGQDTSRAQGTPGQPRPGRRHGAGIRARDVDLWERTARQAHGRAGRACVWLESSRAQSYILYTSLEPPASPKACSATPAATPSRWRLQHEAHLYDAQARRDHVRHQRHRLGGRPQLHRLRTADRRHDHDHVRGPADRAPIRASGGSIVEVQPGHASCSPRPRPCACSRSRIAGMAHQVRRLQPAQALYLAGEPLDEPTAQWISRRAEAVQHHRQLLADRDRLADSVQLSNGHRGLRPREFGSPWQGHVRLRREAARRAYRRRKLTASRTRRACSSPCRTLPPGCLSDRVGRRRALRQHLLLHHSRTA
jgi:propionyl-CoA synthetase